MLECWILGSRGEAPGREKIPFYVEKRDPAAADGSTGTLNRNAEYEDTLRCDLPSVSFWSPSASLHYAQDRSDGETLHFVQGDNPGASIFCRLV